MSSWGPKEDLLPHDLIEKMIMRSLELQQAALFQKAVAELDKPVNENTLAVLEGAIRIMGVSELKAG